MTEVQEAIKFKRLSKFEHRYDDYDMVVEINGEAHNLDFLIDNLKNKIIFFYDYGDGDDLDDCKKEIQKLKEQLEICKDARQAYKQDWKACVSYCDTYKDEIHTLKDNIQGLIEENKQLKKEIEELEEENTQLENRLYNCTHYR